MQKRCPWCGKLVNTHRPHKYKRRTPIRFIFDKCDSCGNFYGQDFRSPLVIVLCLAMLSCCLLPLIWLPLQSAIIPALLVIGLSILQIPLRRMTEDEASVECSETIIKASIVQKYSVIKKHYIYAQSPSFDKSEAFSLAAPIYVTNVDRRNGTICFYFLYEHKDNTISQTLTLYDGSDHIADIAL